MFGFFVLLMVLLAFWIVGSLIGAVFKLVFGLIGGVFSMLGGLIGLLIGGVVLLAVMPVIALALLPLWLPLLFVATVIWLIVRAASRPTAPPATPAR